MDTTSGRSPQIRFATRVSFSGGRLPHRASEERSVGALRWARGPRGPCAQISFSPVRGPLVTALERGHTLGHPMRQVLAGLVAARPVDGLHPAADVARSSTTGSTMATGAHG